MIVKKGFMPLFVGIVIIAISALNIILAVITNLHDRGILVW